MASERRMDVPENVGGPASCGNAERLGWHQGLRPWAKAAGAGASTVDAMHEGENRP